MTKTPSPAKPEENAADLRAIRREIQFQNRPGVERLPTPAGKFERCMHFMTKTSKKTGLSTSRQCTGEKGQHTKHSWTQTEQDLLVLASKLGVHPNLQMTSDDGQVLGEFMVTVYGANQDADRFVLFSTLRQAHEFSVKLKAEKKSISGVGKVMW